MFLNLWTQNKAILTDLILIRLDIMPQERWALPSHCGLALAPSTRGTNDKSAEKTAQLAWPKKC